MTRIAGCAVALALSIPLVGCLAEIPCSFGEVGKSICSGPPPPTILMSDPVAPEPGKALVVFLVEGNDISSSVFEVKDNQLVLAGGRIVEPPISRGIKTGYQSDPGKRLFMVIGQENADFMTADLLANRTYYVHVFPRFGWRQRCSFKPVVEKELDSVEFEELMSKYSWAGTTWAAENWARDNMGRIEAKRAKYYADWVREPESKKQNLAQSDGR